MLLSQSHMSESECTSSYWNTTCPWSRSLSVMSTHLSQIGWAGFYNRNIKVLITYLVLTCLFSNLFLTVLNNYSMGFNHGLYCALNRTLTFSFWHVDSTSEWWWKIALSISRTTLFLESCSSERMWNSIRNSKSSNSVASYAPSMISEQSNSDYVIAATNDMEYICFLTSLFLIDKSNVLKAYGPSCYRSLFADLSYKVLPTIGSTVD